MAYDETLATRIRQVLEGRDDVAERRMFGGLAFMVRGHMACGVVGAELMVRVGAMAYDDALGQPHARPMDFTGRPMRGMVFVDAAGVLADADLARWVGHGVANAETLPPR